MSKQRLPTKSFIVAILLAIFLGPIGLFYATVVGALVMLVITVIIGFVTFGLYGLKMVRQYQSLLDLCHIDLIRLEYQFHWFF
jgi:putative Ca2+/H+ antiporter (TMEM165/GDT1 family)